MSLSGHTTWWLLGGLFLFLVAQMGVENIPLTLLHFWHCRQLLVRRNKSLVGDPRPLNGR